jgi:hypothetical protein
MTNEQPRELLELAINQARINLKSGDLWDEQIAQSVIEALTPMMREVVAYMWHQGNCDFITSFTKDCSCNYHNVIASLPDCWREKGGV